MVKLQRKIVWDKSAYTSLQAAYEFIKSTSVTGAEKVREEILKIVKSLPNHPEKYPIDKFRKDNNGSYRAFEKYSYRVEYKISRKQIIYTPCASCQTRTERILSIKHYRLCSINCVTYYR